MRRYDVFTFGETMLRLSPPGHGRIEDASALDVRIGGSESNVAIALARLGLTVAWSSRLPAHPLGRRIENEIRRWGVDTSRVLWDTTGQARAGLCFVEGGVLPRAIDVLYDRGGSSFSKIRPQDIGSDWGTEAALIHLSGITPALSQDCAAVVELLMQQARESGAKVSFDTNFRRKLWPVEKARPGLERLLPLVDLLLCPRADAETVFGIAGDGSRVAGELRTRYGLRAVVVTCGNEGACAVDEMGTWTAPVPEVGPIIDRVGRGDAFTAGVLFGYLRRDLALGLDYGVAMAALKQTIPGDFLLATAEEIEAVRRRTGESIRR